MKIDYKELNQIITLVMDRIDYLVEDGKIDIGNIDYYWSIDENEKFNMSEEPKEFLVGQLSEDIDFLKRNLIGDEAFLPSCA